MPKANCEYFSWIIWVSSILKFPSSSTSFLSHSKSCVHSGCWGMLSIHRWHWSPIYFTCLASMSFLLSIITLNTHSHWIAATCNSWLQSLQERICFLLYQAPCIPRWVMPGFNSSHQPALLVAQMVENLPATRDIWVRSLGWEDWATKTFINLVPRRGGGSISWRRYVPFWGEGSATPPSMEEVLALWGRWSCPGVLGVRVYRAKLCWDSHPAVLSHASRSNCLFQASRLSWLTVQLLWSSVLLVSESVPHLSQISDDRQEGPFWKQPKRLPVPNVTFLLLLFSCQVVSNCSRPHGLQHPRLPCPSLCPGVCPNSCPLSGWCHPIISSSVSLFSSCLQSSQHQVFNYHWIFIYLFYWSIVDLQCYVSLGL